MSEGKDVDNQEISWDMDDIVVHATLTLGAARGRHVDSHALTGIETWLAPQSGLERKEDRE
jgi:hypothetical protein